MMFMTAAATMIAVQCATGQPVTGPGTQPAPDLIRSSEAFWATVPRGICIWKNRPFGQDDIRAVAKYRLVQTMIPNGIPWRDGTGNIALEIKKHNPDALVIGYKNIVVHYEYHAHPEIFADHPGWFVHDRRGRPAMHNNKRPLHDLRDAAMRRWWVEDVHGLLGTQGFDGILIDAVTKVYYYAPILNAMSSPEHADYIRGFDALMQDMRKRCAGQGLLIGNCLRAVHDDAGSALLRKYYDGSYLELFDTPMAVPGRPALPYEEWVARGIEAVQRASAEGQLIFLTMAPGRQDQNDVGDARTRAGSEEPLDYDKLYADHEYKLAIFLICAGERSYWGYQHSRNAADDPRRWDADFPEYHHPLGAPKGPASRRGYTYTREFRHATVSLDLGTRKASILWR